MALQQQMPVDGLKRPDQQQPPPQQIAYSQYGQPQMGQPQQQQLMNQYMQYAQYGQPMPDDQ